MLLGALLSAHKAEPQVRAPSAVRGSSPPLPLAHRPTWLFPRTTTSSQTKLNLASQASLSFQLLPSANSTSSLPNAPKDKGGRICFNSSHLSLPFIKSARKPRCFFSQNVSTFPLCLLIPANSTLLQGFTAFCLYYCKQILSCLPASGSSYTVTRIIQTEYSLSSLPGLKFPMKLVLHH